MVAGDKVIWLLSAVISSTPFGSAFISKSPWEKSGWTTSDPSGNFEIYIFINYLSDLYLLKLVKWVFKSMDYISTAILNSIYNF